MQTGGGIPEFAFHREFALRVAFVSPKLPLLRTFVEVEDGAEASVGAGLTPPAVEYEAAIRDESSKRYLPGIALTAFAVGSRALSAAGAQ